MADTTDDPVLTTAAADDPYFVKPGKTDKADDLTLPTVAKGDPYFEAPTGDGKGLDLASVTASESDSAKATRAENAKNAPGKIGAAPVTHGRTPDPEPSA
jgi:hypothetical protein